MAGGIGSRFWPISREAEPKQFLDFTDSGISFLRKTYDRFARFIPKDNIIVVSLTRYKDLVKEHLPELKEENLLLEPYNRNTAPCLTFATYSLLKRDPQAVMVATPSDHMIGDDEEFSNTITNALDYAAQNKCLITLGIVPDRPDANFGYIQASGGKDSYSKNCPVKVKTFTEKPSADLAEIFIKSGEFLWNSGIFVWQAQTIREELEHYIPEVTGPFKGWESNLGTSDEKRFLEKAYMNMERLSIDYGVMEKTEIAWLYPAKFGWADIGNWESLYSFLAQKDSYGNAIKASKSMVREGSSNNIIYTKSKGKLVAISGLENYVIVDTDDILMICPRDDKKLKGITTNMAMPEFEDYR